jgi:fibronectin type 3 domain-containing protein
LQLVWGSSSSTDTIGYRVYYGTASGSYQQSRGSGIIAGNSTRYAVTGLAGGRTYYFAVTAYDSAGNESAYSAEVSKAIP